jgi:hypothetical protein
VKLIPGLVMTTPLTGVFGTTSSMVTVTVAPMALKDSTAAKINTLNLTPFSVLQQAGGGRDPVWWTRVNLIFNDGILSVSAV